jgi:hypothetical protein
VPCVLRLMCLASVAHAAGRPEMVVGWYHSHPGFGCWLSGVDVNTQQSFEQLNPRAVAVVVDPIQVRRRRCHRGCTCDGGSKETEAEARAVVTVVVHGWAAPTIAESTAAPCARPSTSPLPRGAAVRQGQGRHRRLPLHLAAAADDGAGTAADDEQRGPPAQAFHPGAHPRPQQALLLHRHLLQEERVGGEGAWRGSDGGSDELPTAPIGGLLRCATATSCHRRLPSPL